MLEVMVEYGRRGLTSNSFSVRSFSDDISHLEVYKLSTLTEVELRSLMFFLGINKSNFTDQPVNSMDSDEMRMEYMKFRKDSIAIKDDLIDDAKMVKTKYYLDVRKYLRAFVDVLKYS